MNMTRHNERPWLERPLPLICIGVLMFVGNSVRNNYYVITHGSLWIGAVAIIIPAAYGVAFGCAMAAIAKWIRKSRD